MWGTSVPRSSALVIFLLLVLVASAPHSSLARASSIAGLAGVAHGGARKLLAGTKVAPYPPPPTSGTPIMAQPSSTVTPPPPPPPPLI
ncbi:hypothetical protein ACP70R_030555 [Stipagrostis hirtigluma subsp. patula]